jgi:hypothetical protein
MFSTRFAALVGLAAVGLSTGAEAARTPVTGPASSLTSQTVLPRNVLEDLLEMGERKSGPIECPICSRPSPGTMATAYPRPALDRSPNEPK